MRKNKKGRQLPLLNLMQQMHTNIIQDGNLNPVPVGASTCLKLYPNWTLEPVGAPGKNNAHQMTGNTRKKIMSTGGR
jgi:hypothetical protein